MKLIATSMLSVDGVFQGPGGPDEDRRDGFERGGWATGDEESWRWLVSLFERADALLLGRRTWQIFEGYWPHHDKGPTHKLELVDSRSTSSGLTLLTYRPTGRAIFRTAGS